MQKKTVIWKVGSMPFEHVIWQCANKLRKDILSLEQKPSE